ncbi:hypothetical protein MMC31_005747, partial [Peltigera leucophlebia]|nr:hypothetical protein [Peltigera leucophlebia]
MTSLPAKHDALGNGELRDGMGADSPSDLVDREEGGGGEKVREYADIIKHGQQQNQLSLSQVKTTEQSTDDSDEQIQGEPSGPPQHAGFWDHSMINVRMHVMKLWARDVLILFIAIILVLSCFEAVFFHIPANLKKLTVFVVDFDGKLEPFTGGVPVIGPQIVESTEAIAKSDKPRLGYVTMPPSNFNNDPIAVRQAIYDFKAYAAIIVNANATALLRQAIEQGNSSYDPNGAVQTIYVSARDSSTIPTYVVPYLGALEKAMVSQIGASWVRSVMQNTSLTPETIAQAPQALSPAIGFTSIDLRPFGPATAAPWVSIGLIYLIIIAFFSFSFFLPIHLKYIQPRGHPPLHFHQLIIWRWIATVAAYLLFSLAYSLVPLAFQIPLSSPSATPTEPSRNPNAYGKGTFLVYWMVNWVGMAALGLACENVAMLLGQPWTAIWLIFWVITNVSTAFFSIDISPAFFKWGYAWPLYH